MRVMITMGPCGPCIRTKLEQSLTREDSPANPLEYLVRLQRPTGSSAALIPKCPIIVRWTVVMNRMHASHQGVQSPMMAHLR